MARGQHGIVSIGQLRALGLTPWAITRRVAAGHLHPLHRGVYAVGHTAIGRHGRWLSAVLACGPGAALSHRDAGMLSGLPGALRGRIDVTTPRRGRGARPGIELHRVRALAPQDVTVREGIPVTTIARTLVDLADVLSIRDLQRAFHEAEVLRLLDARAVTQAAKRVIGRPGLHRIDALIEHPAAPLRSELERRFLTLCHTAGLPTPEVNSTIHAAGRSIEVDFHWPAQRLVVETDGAAAHATRRAFEEDRRRDVELTIAGLRVVRFTWRRITDTPGEVGAALAALLSPTP